DVATAHQLVRIDGVCDALEVAARLDERIGEADARELDAIAGAGGRREILAAPVAAHRSRNRLTEVAFEHRNRAHDLGEAVLLFRERAARRRDLRESAVRRRRERSEHRERDEELNQREAARAQVHGVSVAPANPLRLATESFASPANTRTSMRRIS